MSRFECPALEELARRPWDALVVGAGPAGTTAAHRLAAAGARVLLVERQRLPRYKVCGGCVSRRSLGLLERYGLGAVFERLDAPCTQRLALYGYGRRIVLELPAGLAVSRTTLDAELARAAVSAGAVLADGTTAWSSTAGGSVRQVELRQGQRASLVTAAVVVATDGLGGRLLSRSTSEPSGIARRSRIGAGALLSSAPTLEPGTITMGCGRGGYVGLVRVERGAVCVAAALDAAWVRRQGGLSAAAAGVLQAAGIEVPAQLRSTAWRGTPPLTQSARRVAAHRLLAAGDATGYVEPFTGEGIGWAVEAGALVARHVLRALAVGWSEALLADWQREHRRLSARRQRACRLLTAGLRRPWLTTLALASLARLPALARPWVGRIVAPEG